MRTIHCCAPVRRGSHDPAASVTAGLPFVSLSIPHSSNKKPVEKLTPRDAPRECLHGVNSSTGSLSRVGRKCRGTVCRRAADTVDIVLLFHGSRNRQCENRSVFPDPETGKRRSKSLFFQ